MSYDLIAHSYTLPNGDRVQLWYDQMRGLVSRRVNDDLLHQKSFDAPAGVSAAAAERHLIGMESKDREEIARGAPTESGEVRS